MPKPRSASRAFSLRGARPGQDAQLHRGVVQVEERADAVQPPAGELAVEDRVDDQEPAGGGEALQRLRVIREELDRRGQEAPVREPLARLLQPRVRERGPQAGRVRAIAAAPSSGFATTGSS
jgi:hypothetical protein